MQPGCLIQIHLELCDIGNLRTAQGLDVETQLDF